MAEQETQPENKPAATQPAPDPLAKLHAHAQDQIGMLKINELDINNEFINQAPNYVRANIRYNKAQEVIGQIKLEIESLISQKDAELRSSGAKVTEAFIDKTISGDADVLALKRKLNLATTQVNIYQSICRGWEQKKDMLVQLGSTMRAEINGQVSINKTQQQ